ncbi:MAG: MBOAT family O-acyltransferase [Myxococcota bacterium]
MSFVEPAYPVLLALVLALCLVAPHRVQNLGLLVASCVFYGWIHPAFLGLLVASAGLDFGCALAIRRWPARKRWFLGLSIAGSGSLLGFFKYYNFFAENVAVVVRSLGLGDGPGTLRLILPVGISFYTFQTLAYVIDVYRGRVEPRRSFLDYLLFVTFFPQLVAGPIERASALFPQLERPRTITAGGLWSGLVLASWGAFKKVVIADTLAVYVNAIWRHPDPSFAMIWAAALGFLIQILADFTGYADIARGSARMLGIELSVNFTHPLLATSPTDLWSRWHITFSRWLQDYVYFPLATSRWVRRVPLPGLDAGTRTAVIAILGTLLFSGLWHGAAWHFVLWGLFYGVLQVGWLLVGRRLPPAARGWSRGHWVTVPIMFGAQLVAAMLFREPTVAGLVHHFTAAPWAGTRDQWALAAMMLGLVGVGSVPLWIAFLTEGWAARLAGSPLRAPIESALVASFGWAIVVFSRPTATDFVYFQF